MKRSWLSYLCLVMLTQCAKCKRDAPQPAPNDPLTLLPPESQTGRGILGCLINGKAYVAPYTTSASGDWQSPTKLAIGSTLRLDGEAGGEMATTLIALNGLLQSNQTYSIISSATPFPIFTAGVNQFYTHVAFLPCVYDGDYIKSGQVQLVKFDGGARIASGRFAFTLYKPGGCDTLHVSNGRFDVKF